MLGEFELISQYFSRAPLGDDVLLGIGDDAALVQLPAGRDLVVSVDTLVEGTHFLPGTHPQRIAMRALCTALSDLAAMGAVPHWFTLALTLPKAEPDWLAAFAEGLFTIANRYQCSLIGGDTTRGPLSMTIQVHGSVPKGQALRRHQAIPNDFIYVTGSLGDGAAALAVLKHQLTVTPDIYSYLLKRFFAPSPKLLEGQRLLNLANAAIDISDGLSADLQKICSASGVGYQIHADHLPISPLWRDLVGEAKAQDWALNGGDDYQLCFTVPPDNNPIVQEWIRDGYLLATPIGRITRDQEAILLHQGQPLMTKRRGFDHFA